MLGTLDAPVAGSMEVDGVDVLGLGDADLARFRNRTVGFVFQSHYLLPEFTAAGERGHARAHPAQRPVDGHAARP